MIRKVGCRALKGLRCQDGVGVEQEYETPSGGSNTYVAGLGEAQVILVGDQPCGGKMFLDPGGCSIPGRIVHNDDLAGQAALLDGNGMEA